MCSRDLETEYKGRLLAVKNLPTLPSVLQEAMALMDAPTHKVSMVQIADVISRDQVLSAKVLKMVNSPIYGFPGRISSIQNALVLLGFNVVKGAIISTVAFEQMSKSMIGLWEHSIACSLACRSVARYLGLSDSNEYALAGLLHDFGKVITALQIPEARRDIEFLVRNEDIFYYEAEQLLLGFGHTRVNKWLALHWHLPPALTDGISCHHEPMQARHNKLMPSVVQVGDFFARLFECGFAGDGNIPQPDPKALNFLGLDKEYLGPLVDSIADSLDDIRALNIPQTACS